MDIFDKISWFPTFVTDAIQKGCKHPVADVFTSLPESREKQEIERKLEHMLHPIMMIANNQTQMKETARFQMKNYYLLTFLNVGKNYKKHDYRFTTFSQLRKEVIDVLEKHPKLTYETRGSNQKIKRSDQMDLLNEKHIDTNDWELTFANNCLLICCNKGSRALSFTELMTTSSPLPDDLHLKIDEGTYY